MQKYIRKLAFFMSIILPVSILMIQSKINDISDAINEETKIYLSVSDFRNFVFHEKIGESILIAIDGITTDADTKNNIEKNKSRITTFSAQVAMSNIPAMLLLLKDDRFEKYNSLAVAKEINGSFDKIEIEKIINMHMDIYNELFAKLGAKILHDSKLKSNLNLLFNVLSCIQILLTSYLAFSVNISASSKSRETISPI